MIAARETHDFDILVGKHGRFVKKYIIFVYIIVFYFEFVFLDVSMKEYEDKAVFLALNPPKLHALRNKLKAARFTCPLFDTARWVKKTSYGHYFIIILTSTLNLYILM